MRCLALLILAAASPLSFAQDDPMAIMRGEGLPSLVKLQDIPAEATAVRLGTSGSGGMMESIMGGMMMPFLLLGSLFGGGAQAGGPPAALQFLDVSWVLPKSVRLANREFVATYRIELDLTAGPPKEADAIMYRLTYIDVDSVKSITPMPDLTREKLREALQSLAKANTATPPAQVAVEGPADAPDMAVPTTPETSVNAALSNAHLGLLEELRVRDGIVPWVQSSARMRTIVGAHVMVGAAGLVDAENKPLLFNTRIAGTRFRELSPETVVFFSQTIESNGIRRAVLVGGSVVEIKAADWEAALGPRNLKRYGTPIKD